MQTLNATKVRAIQKFHDAYYQAYLRLNPEQRTSILLFLETKQREYLEADPQQDFDWFFGPAVIHNCSQQIETILDPSITIPGSSDWNQVVERLINMLSITVNVLTDYDDILDIDPDPSWAETWFYNIIPNALLELIFQDLDFSCDQEYNNHLTNKTMKSYETQHGYLALHAMMIHIWNLGEALSPKMDPEEATEYQKMLTHARLTVRDVFKIDPDAIIPDEDWNMANLKEPDGYRYEITVLPDPEEPQMPA
jgi:hypothetical protein